MSGAKVLELLRATIIATVPSKTCEKSYIITINNESKKMTCSCGSWIYNHKGTTQEEGCKHIKAFLNGDYGNPVKAINKAKKFVWLKHTEIKAIKKRTEEVFDSLGDIEEW